MLGAEVLDVTPRLHVLDWKSTTHECVILPLEHLALILLWLNQFRIIDLCGLSELGEQHKE